MVIDPGAPQLQPHTVESIQTQPPKMGQPKAFEWGSRVITKGSECDAKTLAARRKRSEIRRLKLMAAALEESAEPLLKRSKTTLPNGPLNESKASARAHDCAEERGHGMCMSGMPRRCDDGNTACNTGFTSGAGKIMEVSSIDMSMRELSNTGAGQGQGVGEDGDGGSEVKSRLSVFASNAACPSHCVMSICGRSREMEDAAIAAPSFLSLPSSVSGRVHSETFHFYGVYDGHGGRQAAEYCKERMHGVLAEEMSAAGNSSPSLWESCMQASFKKLDAELCGVCPHGSGCPLRAGTGSTSTSSCREPLVQGSVGTTAVVAVVGVDHIVVGNCGDSRAVLSRGGQAVPLSCDHKANRPDEVARIEAEGGHVFTWQGYRVCGVLAMSRALGDSYLKPYVSGQPEVTVTARSDDDECLILASDGLWDVLSNDYVCSVARKALAGWRRQHTNLRQHHSHAPLDPEQQHSSTCGDVDSEDSPAQVVAALLTKLALAKHSKDNISVVVVDLKRL
eukprot:c3444_g1_i1 orf=295-1818(-)